LSEKAAVCVVRIALSRTARAGFVDAFSELKEMLAVLWGTRELRLPGIAVGSAQEMK
jgi:hypothetical protein